MLAENFSWKINRTFEETNDKLASIQDLGHNANIKDEQFTTCSVWLCENTAIHSCSFLLMPLQVAGTYTGWLWAIKEQTEKSWESLSQFYFILLLYIFLIVNARDAIVTTNSGWQKHRDTAVKPFLQDCGRKSDLSKCFLLLYCRLPTWGRLCLAHVTVCDSITLYSALTEINYYVCQGCLT